MSDRTDPTSALSELAYEQASRALVEQQRMLDGLRNRAGTLLTGAAISTSFLGGQALGVGGSLRILSWLAIGCFVIVGLSSLAILWPRLTIELTTWRLPGARLGDVDRPNDSVASVRLGLAEHLHLAYDRNEQQIARIAWYLRTSSIFLAFEVIWWVADLATRS